MSKLMPQSHESKVYEILPPPFEWVKIPHGKVTLVPFDDLDVEYDIYEEKHTYLTTEQTITVPTFEIAKYPVTNAQYRQFVEAGGYEQKKYWTPAGWKTCEQKSWSEPEFWQNEKWNGADYPVIGVSWYEAGAFCNWLSAASGELITLPTEQQWQRAAQGNDNRVYPWGDQWEADACNTGEAGIQQTTPVQQYEGRGDSPFGVVDMVGNVWEWCLTAYESGSESLDGTDARVLRGGAFDSNRDFTRAASRLRFYPYFRFNDYGFRLCRPSSAAEK